MDVKSLVAQTEHFSVLYIEDDIEVQQDTKSIFENLFLTIDTANDGLEGLQKYSDFFQKRRSYYDLVISDITMPNMDGILMSKKILEINKQQPILILSAYNDSDKLVKLIDLGVSNFLHKPIETQTLFRTLQKISLEILEYQRFEKNIDKIKSLNDEYNSIISHYDKFVIATRTDLEGKFVDISKAYEDISGYKKEELLGQNASILRHKDMGDTFYNEMWETIQAGEIWSGEIKNIKKNGEVYWISSIISPYINKNEQVIGYNAISEDITRKKKIETLNTKIQIQTEQLQHSNEKLYELLNNTEQGFLSCDKEMKVEKDYSRQCTKIIGKEFLENQPISVLLFKKDIEKKELFEFGYNLLINEEDPFKQKEIFTLMPKEHTLKKKQIRIEYKYLSNQRIMLILTDITREKQLKEKLNHERELHRMIIAVMSQNNQFWETKDEFIHFIQQLKQIHIHEGFIEKELSGILRQLHTFKGLFSQKELIHTPKKIHKLELAILKLLQKESIKLSKVEKTLKKNKLEQSINKDIEMIIDVVGESFLQQSHYRKVHMEFIDELVEDVKSMLQEDKFSSNSIQTVLQKIEKLKENSLFDILNSHGKQALKVASIFEKRLNPVEVSCNKYIRIEEQLLSFFKSLVHIFRNAVIHGIEDPAIRASLNKKPHGFIQVIVREKTEHYVIKICDDGSGLDLEAIKSKALQLGYDVNNLNALSKSQVINLIFNDNLSTYCEINEYAGRGVGLSAVYEELKKVNGRYKIKSKPNQGLTWIFTIPKSLKG